MTPTGTVDPRFGDPSAPPLEWAHAVGTIADAELWWLTTIRSDRRPHVTPLVSVWINNVAYFATGEGEQKTVNLRHNPQCVLTTGCNQWQAGVDITVNGSARRVLDPAELSLVADGFRTKYGTAWDYRVDGDHLLDAHGTRPIVFAVEPHTVFGFSKGDPFRQTRWSFSQSLLDVPGVPCTHGNSTQGG